MLLSDELKIEILNVYDTVEDDEDYNYYCGLRYNDKFIYSVCDDTINENITHLCAECLVEDCDPILSLFKDNIVRFAEFASLLVLEPKCPFRIKHESLDKLLTMYRNNIVMYVDGREECRYCTDYEMARYIFDILAHSAGYENF